MYEEDFALINLCMLTRHKIKKKTDSLAVASTLGPSFNNIFRVHQENEV